jgi:predicted nucleic acid-binding protein
MTTGRTDTILQPIYLDASALVKLVVPEPGSDSLNEALLGAEDVVVSDLALTETASALGRRTREGRLSPARSRRL